MKRDEVIKYLETLEAEARDYFCELIKQSSTQKKKDIALNAYSKTSKGIFRVIDYIEWFSIDDAAKLKPNEHFHEIKKRDVPYFMYALDSLE